MLNFAHRGFSGKYPENTRLAFTKAIETEGCDGIETDVQLSADGVPVIIHDETLDRTAVNMTGAVKDYTLEELRKADLSYTYAGKCELQQMMTLREFLELVKPSDLAINLELKTGVYEYEGIEQKVIDLLKEFDMVSRTVISSFNHFTLKRVKAICPEIRCGCLIHAWLLDPAGYVKANGFECWHPEFHCCTPENVKALAAQHVEVNCWTVNSLVDIRKMFQAGVTSIIGNYPDLVSQVRDELEEDGEWPLGWSVCGFGD